MIKPAHWRQSSPTDQLTAIRMAMEGDHSNFMDGIIEKDKYRLKMDHWFTEMQALDFYLRNPDQW